MHLMRLLIFFTFPALALYEYAPFMSSTLLMTELEAVKEDRFHPLNIFWHRWGASSLSLCAINAIVDFFHISCISALRICTIHVINIDNRSDRDHQRGQISSPQQIIWHRLGASSLSMCAINTIIDFLHILH